jgi:hypothetical protein
MNVNNKFAKIFEVEIECWCFGLQRIRGAIEPSMLHKVINELAPLLREAIEQLYVCDLIDTARRLISAARCRVSDKEITFHILSQLPGPNELTAEQGEILSKTVEHVERTFKGAIERFEKKWKVVTNRPAPREAELEAFSGLTCPPKLG